MEKKNRGSFAPHGERVKKKDRKGEFHKNIHNVEKVIPERGDVHRAGRAEKQTARAAERPVSENLLRSL